MFYTMWSSLKQRRAWPQQLTKKFLRHHKTHLPDFSVNGRSIWPCLVGPQASVPEAPNGHWLSVPTDTHWYPSSLSCEVLGCWTFFLLYQPHAFLWAFTNTEGQDRQLCLSHWNFWLRCLPALNLRYMRAKTEPVPTGSQQCHLAQTFSLTHITHDCWLYFAEGIEISTSASSRVEVGRVQLQAL